MSEKPKVDVENSIARSGSETPTFNAVYFNNFNLTKEVFPDPEKLQRLKDLGLLEEFIAITKSNIDRQFELERTSLENDRIKNTESHEAIMRTLKNEGRTVNVVFAFLFFLVASGGVLIFLGHPDVGIGTIIASVAVIIGSILRSKKP